MSNIKIQIELTEKAVTLLVNILEEHKWVLENNQEGESWQPEELALTEELILVFSGRENLWLC